VALVVHHDALSIPLVWKYIAATAPSGMRGRAPLTRMVAVSLTASPASAFAL